MALLLAAMAPLGGAPLAAAEGGSIGGSIALPTEPQRVRPRVERPAPVERRAPAPRAARPAGGGFDGAWSVTSVGCSLAGTGQTTISQGRVIGQGQVVGSVAPNGAVTTAYTVNGIAVRASGRLAGASGSGTFHQSDGCTGTWRASKI